MSIERVHYFWRHPPKSASPRAYLRSANKPIQKYIAELINRYVNPSCKILEIGCNMGRNLNGLWQIGFKKLSGIEINPEAVALMEITYPEMTDNIEIYTGSV